MNKKLINLLAAFLIFIYLSGIYGCKDKQQQSDSIVISLDLDNELIRKELQFYFDKIFEQDLAIINSQADENAKIIIGTPQHKLINEAVESGLLNLPEGQNADQGYTIKSIENKIYLAAKSDQGLLYGLYELLEQYGCYFQVNGEIIPEEKPFYVKHLDITEKPVFKYRGLLPWDNFLCGMSGYNLEHYQLLIDRITRMKFNMLQFHFYPGMAFFTEEWDDNPVDPTCIGMPVDIFETQGAVAEETFGGTEYFAPKSYVENIGNPRAQAEAVQEMFRKVLDYAHSRKFKTTVGFELMLPRGGNFTYTKKPNENSGGHNFINPLDEVNVKKSVQRLQNLMEVYPQSDYYWLWQSEGRGFLSRNAGNESGAREFREKYHHWAQKSEMFGGEHLAGDIDYAYIFKKVVQALSPEARSKLSTAGWSIGHLFPNINEEIPREVIFASLNNYSPSAAIDEQLEHFKVARTDRRTWMIDWWEFDGNQWFPQFRVNWQQKMYDMCVQFGVESVTLVGWKLSGLEHNIRYLSEFAWNPELSGKMFYASYIKRIFGSQNRNLVEIFNDYDAYEPHSPPAAAFDYRDMLLGAGWSSLGLPRLPQTAELLNRDKWKQRVAQTKDIIMRQNALIKKDKIAIEAIENAALAKNAKNTKWARILLNRLKFRVLYLRSMLAFNEGVLVFNETASEKDFGTAKKATLPDFKNSVELAQQAIEKYAELIDNRNDLGVIAQLNEQYYQIMKMNYAKAQKTSSYATIDWGTFRITPAIQFDFSDPKTIKHRDGKTDIANYKENGRNVIKVSIGEDNVNYNSIFVHSDPICLNQAPFLDFEIRVINENPLAFMFQAEGSEKYYALNIIGKQDSYTNLDSVSSDNIADGQWHRITWDLLNLYKENISATRPPIIKNLILGSWEPAQDAAVVEFRNFNIGKRNTLD